MKILHQPGLGQPPRAEAAAPSLPADLERVEALENVAKSLLRKVQTLEEKIKTLEAAPIAAPAPKAATVNAPIAEAERPVPPAPAPSPVTLDSEAVKKNLLNKMWKYLNEDAA